MSDTAESQKSSWSGVLAPPSKAPQTPACVASHTNAQIATAHAPEAAT
jgi:hypothetical protein